MWLRSVVKSEIGTLMDKRDLQRYPLSKITLRFKGMDGVRMGIPDAEAAVPLLASLEGFPLNAKDRSCGTS